MDNNKTEPQENTKEEEYVKNGGSTCPYCGSQEIEGEGSLDNMGSSAYQRIRCTHCEKEWDDTYILTGFDEV